MKPSELEMQILAVLWTRGPSTAREVLDNMPDQKKRAYTSILSILQLMHRKGLVKRRREGLTHRWRPADSKQNILGAYLGDMIAKIFGGRPSSAFANLLETANVDETELAEMERLIQEHKQRGGL